MRLQEESANNCISELRIVDESFRKEMINWCNKIADILSISRDTVGIAMIYLDRYVSSDKGRSGKAVERSRRYQLTAISAFFLAVKLNEPVEFSVDLLVKLCQGKYSENDILSMERDILFTLDWRVSGPMPMDFARQLFELLPEHVHSSNLDYLMKTARRHMDYASSEFYFSSCKPSVVGAGCVLSALSETDILTLAELDEFCDELLNALDFEESSFVQVLEVQKRLMSQSLISEPVAVLKGSTPSRPKSVAPTFKMDSGSSSPVCVSRM